MANTSCDDSCQPVLELEPSLPEVNTLYTDSKDANKTMWIYSVLQTGHC